MNNSLMTLGMILMVTNKYHLMNLWIASCICEKTGTIKLWVYGSASWVDCRVYIIMGYLILSVADVV